MSKNISRRAPASSGDQWEQRFEAALLERDPAMLARRLQNAKDAILHRIEESCDTASDFGVPAADCRPAYDH